MKLTAIDPWADTGPGFNRQAADVVYKAMSAMDADTALIYGRLLVAGAVHHDLIEHRAEFAKAAERLVTARSATLRKRYTRAAVAKARQGQDNTHEIACLVAISKADGMGFTTAQRQQYAMGRRREGGRFAMEHTKIETDKSAQPLNEETEKLYRIPPAGVTGTDRAHYQQAYQQIQDILAPFHSEELGARLHLNIRNGSGELRNRQFQVPAKGKQMPEIQTHLQTNDRIETAAVSVTPTVSSAGAGYDAMSALTHNPRAAGQFADLYGSVERPGVLNPGRMAQYNKDRLTTAPGYDKNEEYSGTTAAFGSLSRGSALLQDSLGDAAPAKLKYALAVANHIGQFGPEAQKVIGPAADRAAYRYRGTERTPDPAIYAAFADLKQGGGVRGDALRGKAIYGSQDDIGGRKVWNPGPVLRYFQGNLPDADLNELQRRSGVIPPSEGIIIDDQGRIAHQSIGYADDWYLPFNLNHLSALKGGEYIRTRSFGGPTTEDIYTGLISGARSLTVISHSGVFTLDFDRNLRGGRRFNDKAASMVARYGQLLDALRSQKVERGGVSGSRMQELREKAGALGDDESSDEFKGRLRQLQVDERRKPVLSQAERNDAATAWLGDQAMKFSAGTGAEMTGEQLTREIINNTAADRFAEDRADQGRVGMGPVKSQAEHRAEVDREFRSGTVEDSVRAIAGQLGTGVESTRNLDNAIAGAESANRDRVTPLSLDGKGYFDALNALREQFPYYLDKPVYHPWRNSVGVDSAREKAWDTGYVAPRHNRPEKAQAGYFNTAVNGHGKVNAQSIRYQNYRVHGGRLDELKDDRNDEDYTNDGGSGTKVGGGAAATPVVSDTELQHASDVKLLDHLLSKTHFEAGTIADRGGPIDVTGRAIRAEVDDENFPDEALKRLYGKQTSRAELVAAPDLHELLMKVLTTATQGPGKVLTVPDEMVAEFLNRGRNPEPVPVPPTLSLMLEQVGRDHTFPGAVYDPRKIIAPDAITRAYESEPSVRALVASGRLPAISDGKFPDSAKELLAQLNTASAGHLYSQQNGGRGDPVAHRADVFAAEGLLRATQLHRRWKDAVLHQSKPLPAQSTGNSYKTEFHFLGNPGDMSDDQVAAVKDRFNMTSDPDYRNVIGGTVV